MSSRTAIVLCVLVIVAGYIEASESDAQRSLTLIKGVLNRESLIRDIRGFVVHDIYRSESETNMLQQVVNRALPAEDVAPYTVNNHSQFVVRFIVADYGSRWECIALRGGPNPWGLGPNVEGRMQVYSPQRDEEVPGDHARVVVVRDGARQIVYRNWSGTASLSQETVVPPIRQTPLCYLMMFGNPAKTLGQKLQRLYDAPELRAEQEGVRVFSYGGEEQVNGIPCHKLVYTVDIPEFSSKRETWISVDYQYAVVQDRQIARPKQDNQSGSGHSYVAQDFKEIAPGIWLPYKVVRQHFIYSPKVREPWRSTETATFYNLKANTGTTEADFEFELPVGTMISDPHGFYVSDVPGVVRRATEYLVAGAGGVTPSALEHQPPPLDPVLSGQ